MVALLSVRLASPDSFSLVPIDSVTSPPDENGEVEWGHSAMVVAYGWRPRVFETFIIRELLGDPTPVAPDLNGWAFASAEAPDFGVVLAVQGDVTVPRLWDWGTLSLSRKFAVTRANLPLVIAWLNAFSLVHDEIAAGLGSPR